jgi:phasin family protein
MTETSTKTTKSAPSDSGKVASDAFAKGQETFETALRGGSEALFGTCDKWFAFNQERMSAALEAFRGWNALAESGKANLDAALKSTRITAKGFEEIAGTVAAYVAASMADGVAASRATLECKNLSELTEVKSEQFRKFVCGWLAEGRKLSELTVNTATRAVEPIGERINAAIDTVLEPAA